MGFPLDNPRAQRYLEEVLCFLDTLQVSSFCCGRMGLSSGNQRLMPLPCVLINLAVGLGSVCQEWGHALDFCCRRSSASSKVYCVFGGGGKAMFVPGAFLLVQ